MKITKSLIPCFVNLFLIFSISSVCFAGKESGNTRGDVSSPHFAKGSKCSNASLRASEYYPTYIPKLEEQLEFIRKVSLVMYLQLKEEIDRTYVCQAGNMDVLEAYSGKMDQPAIIEMYGHDLEPTYYNNRMEPLGKSLAEELNSKLWQMYEDGKITSVDFNQERAVYLPGFNRIEKFNKLYLSESLMFGIKEGKRESTGYSEEHRAGVFIFEMLHPVFKMAGYKTLDKSDFLNAVLERNYGELLAQFERVGALEDELRMTQEICLSTSSYCVESLLLFPEEVRFSVLVDQNTKASTKVLESLIQISGIESLSSVFPGKDLSDFKEMFDGISFGLETCGYTVPDSKYFLGNGINECLILASEKFGFELSSENRFDIYEARSWIISVNVFGARGQISIDDFRAGIDSFVSLTRRSRKSWELVVQNIEETIFEYKSAQAFQLEILKALNAANLRLNRNTKRTIRDILAGAVNEPASSQSIYEYRLKP